MPKNSQCRKTELGDPLGFFNILSVAMHPKIDGIIWGKKIRKKVSQCRRKLKGGPFSLARYCMLLEKLEKHFWFSSVGKMVPFDTVRVDWKKRVTIIVAFHFMKRRLIAVMKKHTYHDADEETDIQWYSWSSTLPNFLSCFSCFFDETSPAGLLTNI